MDAFLKTLQTLPEVAELVSRVENGGCPAVLTGTQPVQRACVGAAVAAGCVPNTGMERRVWALIPYVLMLISSGVQGWLLYKLTDGGDPVRDYVWKASVPRLPAAGIVTGILALASIVTEIANIFAPNFAGTLPFALGLIGLDVLAGATSVALSRTVKGMEWA